MSPRRGRGTCSLVMSRGDAGAWSIDGIMLEAHARCVLAGGIPSYDEFAALGSESRFRRRTLWPCLFLSLGVGKIGSATPAVESKTDRAKEARATVHTPIGAKSTDTHILSCVRAFVGHSASTILWQYLTLPHQCTMDWEAPIVCHKNGLPLILASEATPSQTCGEIMHATLAQPRCPCKGTDLRDRPISVQRRQAYRPRARRDGGGSLQTGDAR